MTPTPGAPGAGTAPPLGEMDLAEFRAQGHRLIEWIADYLEHPERYPVLARSQPGQVAAQLPAEAPRRSEPLDAILRDFEQVILPGITHWNHPGFLAYFGITGSGPGILGELLCAALDVNAMLWRTSPAATELEERVLDWLRRLLGLPDAFRGMITDTASLATLLAVAAAREATGLEIRERGLAGRPDLPALRMYTSEEAHSSVEKAALALGIGQEGLVKVQTDAELRMDPDALAAAVEADRTRGARPFCVVATLGTTSTTAVDPVARIADVCGRHALWLHVDAAYAGSAALVPECRAILDGCERADSFVVNPHKWLFTPIDCSAFYVRDPGALRRAFSLVPEYLRTEDAGVTNYMDWGVQLGRRFRALKLWLVLRHFGREGLVARLREHLRLARELAGAVDADPDFERLAPTPFSTVCLRAAPRDARGDEAYLDRLNEALLERINAGGEVYLSHTRVRGRFTLRVAIGNVRSDERWVRRAWQLLREHAGRLHAERGGREAGGT